MEYLDEIICLLLEINLQHKQVIVEQTLNK